MQIEQYIIKQTSQAPGPRPYGSKTTIELYYSGTGQNRQSCVPYSNKSGTAHFAICDGCDRTIRGVRYKCVNCIDFDYCADCFRNLKGEHNPSHSFKAIHALDSLKLQANDLYRPAGRVIELGDAGGYW
jgi:hypothetical protein